ARQTRDAVDLQRRTAGRWREQAQALDEQPPQGTGKGLQQTARETKEKRRSERRRKVPAKGCRRPLARSRRKVPAKGCSRPLARTRKTRGSAREARTRLGGMATTRRQRSVGVTLSSRSYGVPSHLSGDRQDPWRLATPHTR